MISKGPFLVIVTALVCLFTAHAHGAIINWKNGASGNWSDPANWHPAQIPGPSDTAVINAKGAYTVTLDTNAFVGGLTLGANDGNTQTLSLSTNTLTLAGQVVITNGGFIDLTSGGLDGATNAILTGTFTCAGATLSGVLTLASNSVINLYGPAGSSNVLDGLLGFTNYGTINWSNVDLVCPPIVICNCGLWDAEANNKFYGSDGASVFNNYGTFRKSGGNTTTLLDNNTLFHTSGTLDVEVGGVTLSSGNGGGIFNIATNAGLALPNFTLTGDATFTGSGSVQGALLGNNGIIHGGLIFDNGSLSGTLTFASNAVANLVGYGLIDFNLLTLTNFGTVNWRGISLDIQSNSEIDNYGLWNAQDDSPMYGIESSPIIIFNNYGTFRKSGGSFATGDFALQWVTFNNFGTLDTEVGVFQPLGGVINCSSGSVINTTSNAINHLGLNLSGDVYFTGSGLVDGGVIGNNAVIHGVVTSAVITLEGTLTLASNSVMSISAVPGQLISFETVTFTNYGTVLWTSSSLGGDGNPQIDNYGLWDITTNTYFFGANGGGGGFTTFNNYGTVRKEGASGTFAGFDSATTFNNLGTLDVEVGEISIGTGSGSGDIVNTASNTVAALGNFENFTLSGGTTFTGTGLVTGNLDGFNGVIHGGLTFASGTLLGTLTIASNAVAALSPGFGNAPISLNVLTLTNCGTVVSETDLQCNSGVQVDNYGLWDAPVGSEFFGDYGGGPFFSTFNNYGTVRKDGDPGSIASFDNATTFNNLGTLDVEDGQVTIFTGSGSGDIVNTASNAIAVLGYFEDFTLSGGSTFTGSGLVTGNLNGFNGVIHGGLTFASGTLSGTLTVASNAVANLSTGNAPPISLNVLTLTNCGTVVWDAALRCSSGVQVDNYGLWDAPVDNVFYGNYGGGPFFSTFNNYGTVRKEGDPGSTATFDSATTFNNFGTLDTESGILVVDTGSGTGDIVNTASNAIVVLGNFENFTLSGSSTFIGSGLVSGNLDGFNGTINGTLTFASGTLLGTLTVASNAVANLSGGFGNPPISLNILTLTNCGTVVWGTALQCSSGVQVDNYGLWDAQAGNIFYGDYGGGPFFSTFNNYGTIRQEGESGSTTIFDSATTFNNFGTLDTESGILEVDTGSGSGDIFNTASNAIVGLGMSGNFTLSGSSTFTGPGLVTGDLNGFNGVILGTLTFAAGTLSGTLTVASNAVATLSGGFGNVPISLNILTLTNCGTVDWNTALQCSSGVQVDNYGLWDASTGNTFLGDYGGGPFFSAFNNYGTVRKDGDSSAATFDSATTFNNPGKVDVQNGLLVLQGTCSLNNGTLNVGISGPGQTGMIDFGNEVQLTGRLSANFETNYSPAVSNSFPVVAYSAETGIFTSLSLPPLPAGLSWQTNYASTTFTLSIVPPPPPQLSSGLNISGHSISLSWNGLSGQTYQVQCTTNLAPANWVNLGSTIPGTNGTITVSDDLDAAQKFYRIAVQ